jgi:hypothetical protein
MTLSHRTLSAFLSLSIFAGLCLSLQPAQAQAGQLKSVVIAQTYWYKSCTHKGQKGMQMVKYEDVWSINTSSVVSAARDAWGTKYKYAGPGINGGKTWSLRYGGPTYRPACTVGKKLSFSTKRFTNRKLSTFRLWNGSHSHTETLGHYWLKRAEYWAR